MAIRLATTTSGPVEFASTGVAQLAGIEAY